LTTNQSYDINIVLKNFAPIFAQSILQIFLYPYEEFTVRITEVFDVNPNDEL